MTEEEVDAKIALVAAAPTATTIRVNVCEHGTVSLLLSDANDNPIATAHLPLGVWAIVTEDAINQIEAKCPDRIAGVVGCELLVEPGITKH